MARGHRRRAKGHGCDWREGFKILPQGSNSRRSASIRRRSRMSVKDVTLNPTKEETGRKSTPNGGRDAEGKMRVDTDRIREVDQSVLTN